MGGINGAELSELIGDIYAASAEPGLWRGTLGKLAGAFRAKSALVRVIDIDAIPSVQATYHHNMGDELQSRYRDGYVQQDPYLAALQRVPAGRMVRNDNLVDLDKLRHTEFYRHYLGPLDNHFIIGGFVERGEPGPNTVVGLHRHSRAQPFSCDELDALQQLAPHLRRSLWLQRQAQRGWAAEAALDALPLACFHIDDTGRLIHANRGGEALLRQDARFTLSGGRVHVASGSGDCLQSMAELVGNRRTGESSSYEPVVLKRCSEQAAPDWVALAAPTAGRFEDFVPEGSATVVYVGTLDQTGVLDERMLRELYGLTPAEARLAIALGRGRGLKELGDEWSVSNETLRTHMKRVLSKTGTSRQSELVRLLTGGASWLEDDWRCRAGHERGEADDPQ